MGKRKGYKPFPTWRRGEVGVINSFLLVEGRKGYKPFPTWGWGEGGVINSFLLVEGRKGYKPFPTFGVGKGRVTNPSLLLVFFGLLGCVFMIQWDKKVISF
jgi:hypothetical protein